MGRSGQSSDFAEEGSDGHTEYLDGQRRMGYTSNIIDSGRKHDHKGSEMGNSRGLRPAKQVLEDAHISVGDDVEAAARDGVIVIAPVKRVRGKVSLQELVARIPDGYRAEETDRDKATGKEVW